MLSHLLSWKLSFISPRLAKRFAFSDTESRVVCSHHLYKVLSDSEKCYQEPLNTSNELDYHRTGTFSLNDFLRVSEDEDLFEKRPLYPKLKVSVSEPPLLERVHAQLERFYGQSQMIQTLSKP